MTPFSGNRLQEGEIVKTVDVIVIGDLKSGRARQSENFTRVKPFLLGRSGGRFYPVPLHNQQSAVRSEQTPGFKKCGCRVGDFMKHERHQDPVGTTVRQGDLDRIGNEGPDLGPGPGQVFLQLRKHYRCDVNCDQSAARTQLPEQGTGKISDPGTDVQDRLVRCDLKLPDDPGGRQPFPALRCQQAPARCRMKTVDHLQNFNLQGLKCNRQVPA